MIVATKHARRNEAAKHPHGNCTRQTEHHCLQSIMLAGDGGLSIDEARPLASSCAEIV